MYSDIIHLLFPQPISSQFLLPILGVPLSPISVAWLYMVVGLSTGVWATR